MGSWGRNPGRGILREHSLGRNPRGGNLEKESWKQDPRRASGAISRQPWEDLQGHSGAGATRATFWAEEKNVSKPLRFSAKSGATDLLACTGARRHAPSTAPAHKSWSS